MAWPSITSTAKPAAFATSAPRTPGAARIGIWPGIGGKARKRAPRAGGRQGLGAQLARAGQGGGAVGAP